MSNPPRSPPPRPPPPAPSKQRQSVVSPSGVPPPPRPPPIPPSDFAPPSASFTKPPASQEIGDRVDNRSEVVSMPPAPPPSIRSSFSPPSAPPLPPRPPSSPPPPSPPLPTHTNSPPPPSPPPRIYVQLEGDAVLDGEMERKEEIVDNEEDAAGQSKAFTTTLDNSKSNEEDINIAALSKSNSFDKPISPPAGSHSPDIEKKAEEGKSALAEAHAYMQSLKRTLSPESSTEPAVILDSENNKEEIPIIDDGVDKEEIQIFTESSSNRVPFSPPPITDPNPNEQSHTNRSRTFSAANSITAGSANEEDERTEEAVSVSEQVGAECRKVFTYVHSQFQLLAQKMKEIEEESATKLMIDFKEKANLAYLKSVESTYNSILSTTTTTPAVSNPYTPRGNNNTNNSGTSRQSVSKLNELFGGDGADEEALNQGNKFYINNPIPTFRSTGKGGDNSASSDNSYTLLNANEHYEKHTMADVQECLQTLFFTKNKALVHSVRQPSHSLSYQKFSQQIHSYIKHLYEIKREDVENELDRYYYNAQEKLLYFKKEYEEIAFKGYERAEEKIKADVRRLANQHKRKTEKMQKIYKQSYESTVEQYVESLKHIKREEQESNVIQEGVYREVFSHSLEEMNSIKKEYDIQYEEQRKEFRKVLEYTDKKYMRLYEQILHAYNEQIASKEEKRKEYEEKYLAYAQAYRKYKTYHMQKFDVVLSSLLGKIEGQYVSLMEQICEQAEKVQYSLYDMSVYDKQLDLYINYLKKKGKTMDRSDAAKSPTKLPSKLPSSPPRSSLWKSKLSIFQPVVHTPRHKIDSAKFADVVNDVMSDHIQLLDPLDSSAFNILLEEQTQYLNFTYPKDFQNSAGKPIMRMGTKLRAACELAQCSEAETLEYLMQLYQVSKMK